MKKVLLSIALFAVFAHVHAQDYKRAFGVRLSSNVEYNAVAASYKVFVTEPGAFEFNVGFGNKMRTYKDEHINAPSVSASAAYQHHFDIPAVEGLKWFVGGGAVVFSTASKDDNYKGVGAGIFPNGGVDYKFKAIPLNLSADFRPTFHLTRPEAYPGVQAHDVGISARYTF